MNMEMAFGKARLLRALTSLDRVEFARLEEALDKLLAAMPSGNWFEGGLRGGQIG